MNGCVDIQERLSAFLDGELTQQDGQRLAVHLDDCPKCRQVFEDFQRMRDDIKRLDWPEPTDEQWSNVMAKFAFKTTRGLGWLLWGGGLAVLACFAAYEFIRDFSFDSFERVGVLAVILGAVLLLLTVISERIQAYPDDKYKDVEK